MGFRNPGINSVSKNPNDIYSIGVVDSINEWDELYYKLPSFMSLEINLGCPNVNHVMIPYDILKKFVYKFRNIIVKVPGNLDWARDIIFNCYNEDVRIFDVCNTIPTSRGGLSGREIQEISLPLIKEVKEDLPDTYIIGSGGIYTIDDVKRYQDVGTDGYALGTIFMTCPWNLFSVCNYIGKLLTGPSQIT
jgi:dihydroorotate dehydrogenase